MKNFLFLSLFLFCTSLWSQSPTIEGDTLLCPDDNGTATIVNDQVYDSYQWYFKYWFLPDAYQAIDGATEASFTYDWFTYDQALLKVVVTLDGNTYESNEIQIDSYAWASLILSYDLGENVTVGGNGELFLCEGASLDVTVGMPYNIVSWYKDDEIIPDANSTTYTITEPGFYYVVAAPDFCPNSTSTSLPMEVYAQECDLGTIDLDNSNLVEVYPNPVKEKLMISGQGNFSEYSITDTSGKVVSRGLINSDKSISFEGLPKGVYNLNLKGERGNSTHKIIKK